MGPRWDTEMLLVIDAVGDLKHGLLPFLSLILKKQDFGSPHPAAFPPCSSLKNDLRHPPISWEELPVVMKCVVAVGLGVLWDTTMPLDHTQSLKRTGGYNVELFRPSISLRRLGTDPWISVIEFRLFLPGANGKTLFKWTGLI
ncbi:hypothetical protein CesoFtcFv8_027385 [Champsocephalus esox]|uniref:Uncharacterized protein n=1 Tax=Champsocephalus esox TaxID=159716 RepID=A0AAN7YC19_9TELE|nr:hypothetical protein CesoFtcFv8_027385 [Champsocephalus esox]